MSELPEPGASGLSESALTGDLNAPARDTGLHIDRNPEGRQSRRTQRLFHTMLGFEIGLGLLALAIGYWLESPSWRVWNWQGAAWWQGILGTIPPVMLLLVMLYADWDPLAKFRVLLEQRVLPLFAALHWWQLLLLAASAGWGEEMLFRGLLQPIFGQWMGNWPGIVVLAILFGLAHALSLLYFVLTVCMSLYLSWLLLELENLAVPILVHGIYDALALLIMHKEDA
jgi:membrane protease YdiL (CAAX protease family)